MSGYNQIFDAARQNLFKLAAVSGWPALGYMDGFLTEPEALRVLRLLRDGSDDAELGRLWREGTLQRLARQCQNDAEEERVLSEEVA